MCVIAIAPACLHPPHTHAPRSHTRTRKQGCNGLKLLHQGSALRRGGRAPSLPLAGCSAAGSSAHAGDIPAPFTIANALAYAAQFFAQAALQRRPHSCEALAHPPPLLRAHACRAGVCFRVGRILAPDAFPHAPCPPITPSCGAAVMCMQGRSVAGVVAP